MPFDATNFDGPGDPAPNRKPSGPRRRFLRTFKESASTAVVVLLAILLGAAAGAAVDGFPDLPPDIPNVPPGSIIAQIISTGVFLLTLVCFARWRVRRQTAE